MTHCVILLLTTLLAQAPQTTSPVGRSTQQTVKIEGCKGQVGCIAVPVDIGGTSVSATTTCHATTAAPTYVDGTDNPVSCDLSGGVRTTGGGGGGGGTVVQGSGSGTAAGFWTMRLSNGVSFLDPRDRNWLLTASDVVDISDRSGRLLGHVTVDNASIAVTGTFWQATQPISGSVSVSNFPASQAVTGAFWPTTAASPSSTRLSTGAAFYDARDRNWSLLNTTDSVNVGNFPASQAVTGTFWQATQPISGSVSVSNFPASQAVTGTFWQATQPVSGTMAVTQSTSPWVDSLPDIAATGTITSTTCPGSGCVALALSGNKSSCTLQVTGVWTGTIQFQALGRTGSFFQISGFGPFSGLPFSQTTANANFTFTVGSYTQIQVVGTAWTSGTATIDWNCGSGPLGNMFSISRIQDGTSNGIVSSVLANDTTAALNGLEVMPAVSKAAPAATTTGRGEFQQQDNVSGGIYVTESATSNNVALSQKIVSVNTTTNVKASAGNVYGVSCANANASICFVQFYNTAGSPTCGTSVIWSLAIPTSGVLNMVSTPPMANHATGIGMCMGTTAAGATACTTANSCTIFYK